MSNLVVCFIVSCISSRQAYFYHATSPKLFKAILIHTDFTYGTRLTTLRAVDPNQILVFGALGALSSDLDPKRITVVNIAVIT